MVQRRTTDNDSKQFKQYQTHQQDLDWEHRRILPYPDRFAQLSCQAQQKKEGQAGASSCEKDRDGCGGCSMRWNITRRGERFLWVLNNLW